MNQTKTVIQTIGQKMAKTAFLASLCILAKSGIAQELPDQDLKEVTVSAARTEQDPNKVGRSITVISQADLEQSIYTNVAEVLSKQEGIFVIGAGQNPGSLQSVFMRGANSEHTTVLIDGVRVTDPSSPDNGINLAELSLANVERIEIVRGSHSTLYGTAAIGGVINIITKKGTEKGLHGNASVYAGTFGESTSEIAESVTLNYALENGIYFSGEVYNTNVKGLNATVDTVTKEGAFKLNESDDFDKLDVIGKVGFKNEKWDVFASYKTVSQTLDIDDGAYRDDENYVQEFKRNLLSYQAGYQVNDKLNVKFLGGFTQMERTAVDDSSIVDALGTYDHAYSSNGSEGTVLNNEIQAVYKLTHASFTLGAASFKETMSTNSFYTSSAFNFTSESDLDTLDINASISSAFVHADLNGGLVSEKLNKLNLGLGTRFNKHSSFGNFVTYELNPSYEVNDGVLVYASVSSGFNAPALYRLYSPNENFNSGVTRGNANLQPETSNSIEFGIKQKLNNKTLLTFAVFQTKVNNLVEYVYLWDKSIGIDTLGNDFSRPDYNGDTYLNIGSQTSKGFEVGIQTALNEKWTFTGNLSLVSGTLEYEPSNSDFTDKYHVQLYSTGDFLTKEIEKSGLVRRSNTANAALSYTPNAKWMLAADVRYASARSDIFYNSAAGPYGALGQTSVGDFTLFGVTARYNVMEKLTTTLQIKNILDTQYQEINGFTTRGRGLYVKLNYQF